MILRCKVVVVPRAGTGISLYLAEVGSSAWNSAEAG